MKGIIDAQVESQSEEAKTAAHWQQLGEEDEAREAERTAQFAVGHEREKEKKK